MGDLAPLVKTYQVHVPAEATAGNDTETTGVVMDMDGTVTGVTYTPATAITGADTNTRKHELVNKGAAGTGTTVVAEEQWDSGVDAAADDETALTLSSTAASLEVTDGDVLALASTHVGTGIADPGGLVTVTVARDTDGS